MTTTEAWVIGETGAAPEMRDWPLRAPGKGEVRLRVRATGLNFADLLMVEGRYQDTPPAPFVPGMEVSGIVEEIGEEVTGVEPGDRVMYVPGHGGLARRMIVAASRLRPVPPSMSDVIAAGFQVTYGSSHLALTRRAKLASGETLVVLGAAGGVGLTAVEIGHRLGARVVAVARGAAKLKVAKAAGAEVLIDSGDGDLLDALRAAGPADVVYDAVGGTAGEAALRTMAPEGRFLIIGFASGALPALKPNHLLVKNQTVMGFYWGGYGKFCPNAVDDSLSELCDWHEKGDIKPHVSHVLPFASLLDGLDMLRNRTSTGKIVIDHDA